MNSSKMPVPGYCEELARIRERKERSLALDPR
jgi:hypothetical protein